MTRIVNSEKRKKDVLKLQNLKQEAFFFFCVDRTFSGKMHFVSLSKVLKTFFFFEFCC